MERRQSEQQELYLYNNIIQAEQTIEVSRLQRHNGPLGIRGGHKIDKTGNFKNSSFRARAHFIFLIGR